MWYDSLEDAIQQLQAFPSPWVDRSALESVLGVGRRRAQQILQPLVRQTLGRNGLASREDVIQHLRHLAAGESAFFEKRRRQRFTATLDRLRREAQERPRVLVEAPTAIVNQELDNLPSGVHLGPGRILIEGFQTPQEAMQKMLALVMAMGNDPLGFEARISAR